MIINCPKCGFSKNVDLAILPGSNIVATCPKCKYRFPIKNIKANPEQNEEEEDIRIVASRAYQREAERFEKEEAERKVEKSLDAEVNPWAAAPGENGWFASFYQTVLHIMFSAPQFFSRLKSKVPMGRALAFFLIVIVAQTLVERMWGELFLSILQSDINNDPQLQNLLKLLSSQTNILLSVLLRSAFLVAQLYILTFLVFLVYRFMAPRETSFPLLFQIMAYSSAPALLCIIPVVGTIAGMFWSIGCVLVGCRAALRLDWARIIIGFLPVIFLLAPLMLQAFQAISTGTI